MANPEHLEILQQGVEAWNKWREENPEITPDLSNTNLSEANLSEADLSNTNLSKANLAMANLFEADLFEANLTVANLPFIGNMREVVTLQIEQWPVAMTQEVIQIGCEIHSPSKWRNFKDEEIIKMDEDALAWSQKWKETILSIWEIKFGKEKSHE